jgi:hypothetical protein
MAGQSPKPPDPDARRLLIESVWMLVTEMKTADKREKVALSRELRGVLADLRELDIETRGAPTPVPPTPEEVSQVDQLAARRKARLADAAGGDVAPVPQ